MNLHNKSSIFTEAIFLLFVNCVAPAIALSKELVQYVVQSRTIEARSAQQQTLYLNNKGK